MSQKLGFNKLLDNSSDLLMPFSVENNAQNLDFLNREGIPIKRQTANYLYITQTPEWVFKQMSEANLTNFYFEYAPPQLLDDTARKWHYVDSVQMGVSPLLEGYTGKDVIIGIVDSGLDYDHPDLIDAFGKKRVIRYWNHSVSNPTESPQPYNYGQIWHEDYIQNNPNTTTSNGNLGHGTTVTGIAAGNGLANGRNKGMAPDAQIIFVETDFNLPNWTLTVADACDYIFRVADSLNKPAVINLSIGTSLGSHDGTDPAGELMSTLVEEKAGRIIIGAAGNSGNHVPFHAHAEMNVSDTSLIWFKNNPDGALGNNFVLFDLWADTNDAQFHYSFGANRNGTYEDVASTEYRFAQINVGTPIYDTLFNGNGDRIATLEVYTEYEANNYHMQAFFSKVDSTDYLMRFNTTGIGSYDLWSGEDMGLNKIVSSLPSPSVYPPIVNYVLPDSAQSVVSSWNCAPEIISVANFRNRLGYVDNNGDMYYPSTMETPGHIAPSSSRGPNRRGVLKPDIGASGELSLGSAPLYMVGNSAYNTSLGEGGYHLRNGGTSMASPIIAGIAALYLERCPKSTAAEFKADLQATAYTDNFTGTVPNTRFGYGKANAFDLLTSRNGNLQILGDTAICQTPITLTTNIELENYNWSTGAHEGSVVVAQPDTIYVYGNDSQGCKIYSDSVIVVQGSPLPNPTITMGGDTLYSSESPNYQWYKNDHPISGATNQTYVPTEPAYYSVAIQGPDNCKSFSNAVYWTLNISTEELYPIRIYPNPANSSLNIKADGQQIESLELLTVTGQKLTSIKGVNQGIYSLDVHHLSSGSYLLKILTNKGNKVLRFFKD